MNDTFKVGEIAIIQNAALAYLNEMECEVIAVYSPPLRWGRLEAHYSIQAANGEVYAAARYHLRKKRPPVDLTTWATEKIKQVTKPINVPEPEMS